MRCVKKNLLLYAVTDRTWCGVQTLAGQVLEALYGGITMLQLREKQLAPELFLQEAKLMKALCREFNVPLIINDNVEIALACQADGVHIGQDDMPIEAVRGICTQEMVIGLSTHSPRQADDAVARGERP